MIDSHLTYAQRMGLSLMKRYKPDAETWHYTPGLGLECLYRVAKVLDKQDWIEWIQKQYEAFFLEDGSIEGYTVEEYSLDQISPGKLFFDFLAKTGDKKYSDWLDVFLQQLKDMPRTPSNGVWHKKIYPNQVWLDGLYMQGSLYLRYAVHTNTVKPCLDDLVYQFELIFSKTWDEKTGLLYHAWDESRKMAWSNPETGLSQCFWSRALGWYCMALVDVLDFIPSDSQYDTYRLRLTNLAARLVNPLLSVQDTETGLWYQVLDQGKRGQNYLESSGSSMFTYFLAKMARKKYLDEASAKLARAAAEKGFAGLNQNKLAMDEDGEIHLIDICRGAGLGKYNSECPFRDGTFEYYTEREPKVWDNLQGVGPYLLAAMEIEYPAVAGKSPTGNLW